MDSTWIALAAVIISASTLILTAIGLRSRTGREDFLSLEHRIKDLERQVDECKVDRQRLQRENIELLRRLALGESSR